VTKQKILLLSLLLINFVNSIEYKQKHNYSLSLEKLKKKLPNAIIIEIMLYHTDTIKYLNSRETKFWYTVYATFFADLIKGYLAIKSNRLPKNRFVFNLNDGKLLKYNDYRYKEALDSIKSLPPSVTYIEGESDKNANFTIYYGPWDIKVGITKKYTLELVRKMSLKQIELLMDIQKYLEIYRYRFIAKNKVLNPHHLCFNEEQTKTFFSLPGFFLRHYHQLMEPPLAFGECEFVFQV